jgi:hypothetical protein
MKTLLLLAGLHKTGTTSIQQTCASNRRLLAESGLALPLIETVHRGQKARDANHSRMLRRMFRKRLNTELGKGLSGSPNRMQEETRREFGRLFARLRADTLVLAAEAVSNFDEDELQDLRAWFEGNGYATRVLLCIRKPSAWLNSMVAQRAAGITSPRLTIDAAIAEFRDAGTLYKQRIVNVRSVFPDADTYDFQSGLAHPYGPVGLFLEKAGVDPLTMPRWQIVKRNEGMSDHAVRLHSAINHAVGERFRSEASHALHASLPRDYPALFRVPGRKFRLRRGEVAAILPIVEVENEWLRQMFGPGYCDERLAFDDAPVALDDATREYLTANLRDADPPIKDIVLRYLAEH